MKLNYNILWIDDTPKWVESIESPLKEHCDELGYRLKVVLEKNGANILEAIKDPELDLIIVDFQLPKITGKDLIETIRKEHVLVEIESLRLGEIGRLLHRLGRVRHGVLI